MRTTTHNGRSKNGKAYGLRHNDRNFDVEKAYNIDPERMEQNKYWHCYPDEELTFEEAELKFYNEHFAEQLQRTNEAYERNGHPERCRTMESWKMVKQNAPEESILQVGKMEEHIDHETLYACYVDYSKKLEAWNEEHGKPFTKLSEAMHADEDGAPHMHTRRVWHYRLEDGTLKIGQEKALAAAGVELPDPSKEQGRRNNRKITFDKMTRQLWIDVLKEHGIDVERDPLPNGRHNREKEDMIRDKYESMLKERDDALKARDEAIEKASEATERAEIAEAKVKTLEQQKEALEGDLQALEDSLQAIEQNIEVARGDYSYYSDKADELINLVAPPKELENLKVKNGFNSRKLSPAETADKVINSAKGAAAMKQAVTITNARAKNAETEKGQLQKQLDFLIPRNRELEREAERLKAIEERRQKDLAALQEWQAEAVRQLKEVLKDTLESYMQLQERRKEAWAARSEAEKNVKILESMAEDGNILESMYAYLALIGARQDAERAKAKHESMCAAVRARKHQLQHQQEELMKQKAEFDEDLQKTVKKAIAGDGAGDTPRSQEVESVRKQSKAFER